MAGYGSFFERDKKIFHPLCFSAGLYIEVLLLWILGFLQLWTSPVLWSVHFVGLGLAIWQSYRVGICRRLSLPKTWVAWCVMFLFAIWFGIAFIRCSAPPYFVDFLQYHLPLSLTFLHAEGFSSLSDFFFGAITTSFAPETFHLLLLGCSEDSATPALFNLVLFSLFLYQIYFHLNKIGLDAQFYTCAALLMGCQTFFHSTVYGKTEIFLMFICMDLVLRWDVIKISAEKIPFNVLFMGLAISMLSFFKISAGLISVACLVYSFSLPQIRLKQNWKWLFFGLSIPIPFYLIQRQITLGMPLFPFLIDPALVPDALSKGVSAWSKGESIVFVDRFHLAIQQTFFGGALRHFNVRGFLLILLAAIAIPAKNKRFCYGSLLLLLFLHWGTWLMQYRFAISTLRLSLPFFVLAIPLFALRVSKSHTLIQRGFLGASLIGLIFLISTEWRVLPGLKVNLGMQTKKIYYVNMNLHVGVLYEEIKPNLNPEHPLLVFAEYGGVFTHPNTHFVNMSNNIHRENFNDQDFFQWLKNNHFKNIILGRAQNYPKVFEMLKKLEANGKVKLEAEYRGACYFRLRSRS